MADAIVNNMRDTVTARVIYDEAGDFKAIILQDEKLRTPVVFWLREKMTVDELADQIKEQWITKTQQTCQ